MDKPAAYEVVKSILYIDISRDLLLSMSNQLNHIY